MRDYVEIMKVNGYSVLLPINDAGILNYQTRSRKVGKDMPVSVDKKYVLVSPQFICKSEEEQVKCTAERIKDAEATVAANQKQTEIDRFNKDLSELLNRDIAKEMFLDIAKQFMM